MSKQAQFRDILNNLRNDLISFIREGVNEQHNGHHYLSDLETFYEGTFDDDNEYKVTEIKVDEKGDVYYLHNKVFDEYDWHYINEMSVEDMLYVAGLYS